MLDPFPIPILPWLSRAVQPFADYASLTTLPLHVHEVLIAFLFYNFVDTYASPIISAWLFPSQYPKFSPDRRKNWDVHVVSLVQSIVINTLTLYVMFADEERKNMDWQQRVWGYTGAAGLVQGFATGYFLWDLIITLRYIDIFGIGMLAHAFSALVVFALGFRPFVNFYGCTFILYELSSPFLNFHWFFDKLDMTGSKLQLYNGVMLLLTFFSCRLVWGTNQATKIYQDVWKAVHQDPLTKTVHYDALNNHTMAARQAAAGLSAAPLQGEIMKFAGDEFVPLWLALTYLGSNMILNTLNFFWFGKMIETIRKRFQPPQERKMKESPMATRSTGVDGKVRIDVDETKIRRRIVGENEDEVPPPT